MEDIRNNIDSITLKVGDLLVDSIIGTIGILMELELDHQVAGHYYKSQFWKVYWISTHPSYFSFTGPSYVEEYGLKMSIAIGIYEYHSVLEFDKEEKI